MRISLQFLRILVLVIFATLLLLYIKPFQNSLEKKHQKEAGVNIADQQEKNLIGIMSVALDIERRSLLRSIYKNSSGNFDIYFVIAKPTDEIITDVLNSEQNFNHDLILLDINENMDEGKTYHFFKYVASLPTRYKFYLKADQDAYLHLHNINKRLSSLPESNVYWGRAGVDPFMLGMLYGATRDLIQYIAKSKKVAKLIVGNEDRIFGYWIEMANRKVSYVSEVDLFYDYKEYGMGWAKDFVNGTLCIHQLKSTEWLIKVAKEMKQGYKA